MKKILLLLIILIEIFSTTEAQYVTIPDYYFRDFLKNRYPTCFDSFDRMDTTCSGVLNEYWLSNNGNILNVASLEGLQYFKNLAVIEWYSYNSNSVLSFIPRLGKSVIKMDIFNNPQLTTLQPLPDSLWLLAVNGNHMTALPNLPAKLEILYCDDNPLGTLPVLSSNLRELFCKNTLLTQLPTLPPLLNVLSCPNNKLQILPPLPQSLITLDCSHNQLTQVSLVDSLIYATLSYNRLTSLPTPGKKLRELICDSNLISSLPTLPPSLEKLDCQLNEITSLPSLPAKLRFLYCNNNKLTQLPALPNTLQSLVFSKNMVTVLPTLPPNLQVLRAGKNNFGAGFGGMTLPSTLQELSLDSCGLYSIPSLPAFLEILKVQSNNDLKCLPLLPQTIKEVYLDTHNIRCIPNTTPATAKFYMFPGGYAAKQAICSPVNNHHGCQAYPLIKGTVYFDDNKNNNYDPGERARTGSRIDLSNGLYTFTNDSGYYELSVETQGSLTVKSAAPVFFSAFPDSASYNFTSSSPSVTRDFALQLTRIKDSLGLSFWPSSSRFRPGFAAGYFIKYINEGSTNLGPTTITFNFDTTKLVFLSTSNASATQSGQAVSLQLPGLLIGETGTLAIQCVVKTSTPIGDSVKASCTLAANSISLIKNLGMAVSGSFDPNDKSATPVLTVEQVNAGAFIEYAIRYQNTGNDTAFHVVIADTLSNLLQANSFEMLASSHDTKVTLRNNILFFEMRNILLPDSIVNEPASHGFVMFRVKPRPVVTAGDVITNKASIYFDYNLPVVTNSSVTLVTADVLPVIFLSFSGIRLPGGVDRLTWESKGENNAEKYEVETSADGRKFHNIGHINARQAPFNYYSYNVKVPIDLVSYYRLKLVDRNGAYRYSNVIRIQANSETLRNFDLTANPVHENLSITIHAQSMAGTRGILLNATGAVAKTFTFIGQENQVIAIGDLPAGIYILQTVSGTAKVIVQ